MKKVIAIRGASTTIANTINDINKASVELYSEMMSKNRLAVDDIVSIIISTTADITATYPAKAIREAGCSAPLFSCMEPNILGSLPYCIRILVTVLGEDNAKHIYLNGAITLRPDLK